MSFSPKTVLPPPSLPHSSTTFTPNSTVSWWLYQKKEREKKNPLHYIFFLHINMKKNPSYSLPRKQKTRKKILLLFFSQTRPSIANVLIIVNGFSSLSTSYTLLFPSSPSLSPPSLFPLNPKLASSVQLAFRWKNGQKQNWLSSNIYKYCEGTSIVCRSEWGEKRHRKWGEMRWGNVERREARGEMS